MTGLQCYFRPPKRLNLNHMTLGIFFFTFSTKMTQTILILSPCHCTGEALLQAEKKSSAQHHLGELFIIEGDSLYELVDNTLRSNYELMITTIMIIIIIIIKIIIVIFIIAVLFQWYFISLLIFVIASGFELQDLLKISLNKPVSSLIVLYILWTKIWTKNINFSGEVPQKYFYSQLRHLEFSCLYRVF